MRIALYFDDKSFKGKDLRYPEKGNPGIGGTPYCFLMLAKYYSITYQKDNIFFYHQVENFQNKYSTEYKAVRVNPTNISEQCIKDKIDFLVLTLSRYRSSVDSLEKQGVKDVYKRQGIKLPLPSKQKCELLTEEELRRMRYADLSDSMSQTFARDMFFFSIYCR